MSDNGFVIGLPSRVDEAAASRVRAQTREHQSPTGFTPAELIQRLEEAFGGGGSADTAGAAPRHFHRADRAGNPTEGWDPLDAAAEPNAFLDPVEVARAEGYEDGVAAATLAAREEAERDRALMAALAAELKAGGAIDRAALADALRRTVLALVGKLVGDSGVSGDLLAARVAAAADLLADAHESAMLRVHPDDVALLQGLLPDTIFPIGDAGVARGSFVLEAASTIVEDGPALWLDQLAGAIDRVPLPAAAPAAA
ncbi:FliH/SctL family protein [uncultured Sphingomonas sp.]|uniref:FliH/SctL family protein n=1 Tax=uncultured Sphingomonas sp. TaxID=158754 RepID=UPI00259021E6|nr:FliH/SctL family protein [uncultured Sphingomonas sp.]